MRMSIFDETWKLGSANSIFRGNSNAVFVMLAAGMLLVTRSVTMHSMATEKEFKRELNFIRTARVEWVALPFMPDMEKLTGCVDKRKILRYSREIGLTCDPKSSKMRQGF